jgi:hypothetical protein
LPPIHAGTAPKRGGIIGPVDARFGDSLLTVRVPRPERSKTRRIKIN